MKDQDVRNCTIFHTVAGSHAYGTNVEGSDTDYRGVCLPLDKKLYFGIGKHNFEQKDKWEDTEDDEVIFDFRKAVGLMLDNNPNMVDLLYTHPRHWRLVKKPWLQIIENRHLFLSKRLRHTYGGYAFAQLKRIRNHRSYLLNPPKERPTREAYNLPERKPVTNDEVNYFMWLLSVLLKDSLANLTLSDGTKQELENVNWIGLSQSRFHKLDDSAKQVVSHLTGAPDRFVESCINEKRYMAACSEWEAYHRWAENRNAKRREIESKYGYDCKHAMHLVRLLRMGIEILKTGEVHVERPDREELIEIRNGAWDYGKLEDYAERCDAKLSALYATTELPSKPAINEVEDLVIEIVESELWGCSST